MKTASTSEIKKELSNATPRELLELCLRLARFKKDNKELMSYLLFEAPDLQGYIESIKKDMDEQIEQINRSSLYFAKKGLRKILKTTNKFIKYTLSKETEVELLIYYCKKIKASGIKINRSTALKNLYNTVLKKIGTTAGNLHEDLQHDYNKELEQLAL